MVGDSTVAAQIETLTNQLRSSDELIVEILEYQLVKKDPPHNIDEIHNKRQELRNQIAKLKV